MHVRQRDSHGDVFETTDDERALTVVKAALKATPEFKAVYFQIHAK